MPVIAGRRRGPALAPLGAGTPATLADPTSDLEARA
jgi:hypothetical protein